MAGHSMTERMGDARAHIKAPLQEAFHVHMPMPACIMQDGGTDPEQCEVDAREAVLDAFAYVRSGAAHIVCCPTDQLDRTFNLRMLGRQQVPDRSHAQFCFVSAILPLRLRMPNTHLLCPLLQGGPGQRHAAA